MYKNRLINNRRKKKNINLNIKNNRHILTGGITAYFIFHPTRPPSSPELKVFHSIPSVSDITFIVRILFPFLMTRKMLNFMSLSGRGCNEKFKIIKFYSELGRRAVKNRDSGPKIRRLVII